MSRAAFIRRMRSDRSGVTLAEVSLLLPVLMLLTFAIMEFGIVMWQHQQAEIAVARALRYGATRQLVTAGAMPDCGVTTSLPAGTPCNEVPGAESWSITCTPAAANVCESSVIDAMLAEIQEIYPRVAETNLVIELRGAGLGFVGFGRPVPLITVRLTGLDYQFIAIGGLAGLNDLQMRDFAASGPAEDLSGV